MPRSAHRLFAALLALALVSSGCGGEDGAPTGPPSAISAEARSYLENLISLMERGSVNRLRIDWTAFRDSVFAAAGDAQSIPDTYPAIRVALALLGDGHSSFRAPDGSVIFVPLRQCVADAAGRPPALPEGVGYVRVGAFGGNAEEAAAFAAAIQDSLRAQDRERLAGWIVDLRGNGGGNMWPMIAGLGPLLGEGILGGFVDPTGAETDWEYLDGASRLGGRVIVQVEDPYRPAVALPRVAVLTDAGVASSGEAAAIAFRARPNTRSFGGATCGLSTANAGFPQRDGAVLSLTVAVMTDRTGLLYGDVVVPDEEVAGSERVVERAAEWLLSGS